MKSMSEFARTLRDQAVKPKALDVEFARTAVAELRHNLDAMEVIHQKHMQAMSAEMKSKMQMMMEKMGNDVNKPIFQSLDGPQLQRRWVVRLGWQWEF